MQTCRRIKISTKIQTLIIIKEKLIKKTINKAKVILLLFQTKIQIYLFQIIADYQVLREKDINFLISFQQIDLYNRLKYSQEVFA